MQTKLSTDSTNDHPLLSEEKDNSLASEESTHSLLDDHSAPEDKNCSSSDKHSASDNPVASHNKNLNPSPALEEYSLAYLEEPNADLFSENYVLVGGKDKEDV